VPATSSAVFGDRTAALAETASGPIIGASGVLRVTTSPKRCFPELCNSVNHVRRIKTGTNIRRQPTNQ
jgi:hypothetical protein